MSDGAFSGVSKAPIRLGLLRLGPRDDVPAFRVRFSFEVAAVAEKGSRLFGDAREVDRDVPRPARDAYLPGSSHTTIGAIVVLPIGPQRRFGVSRSYLREPIGSLVRTPGQALKARSLDAAAINRR